MPETNVYQVYAIRNTAGKFYIGLSENIEIRLRQHNQGVSKWDATSRTMVVGLGK